MLRKEILEVIICPTCRADAIGIGGGRYPEPRCGECGATYSFVKGILDLAPRQDGERIRPYRTGALYDAIARWYDLAAPAMSMAVWNCPPLRYVDWAYGAVGRAKGKRLLVNPVGTGLLLRHVYSVHTDFPIVGVDISWRMLRRAQRRFERSGIENVALIRADPGNLPFADGAFGAIMSMNGLNGFHDRAKALAEMARTLEPGATIAGSSICRGLRRTADFMLSRYERWGVFPILHSRDFLIAELADAFGDPNVRFATHGAAVFFMATGRLDPTEPVTTENDESEAAEDSR